MLCSTPNHHFFAENLGQARDFIEKIKKLEYFQEKTKIFTFSRKIYKSQQHFEKKYILLLEKY